jgi:hypothetical protein
LQQSRLQAGTSFTLAEGWKSIADCFVCFLPKPDIVVDDRLEQLLDHCEFVHPNNALGKTEATLNTSDGSDRSSGDSQ